MAISLTSKATSTKTVMLQIDPDLYARIKVAAKQHNIAASAAMRQILEQGITEIEAANS
jgi:plasmid stability protein